MCSGIHGTDVIPLPKKVQQDVDAFIWEPHLRGEARALENRIDRLEQALLGHRMGRIGEPQRHIEIEPLENPADAPVHEPAAPERTPAPAPAAPEREPEKVPA